MTLLRPMAVILPMALLVACGGGGSGGTALAPETGPLTTRLIESRDQAIELVGGAAPPDLNSEQIQERLTSIAKEGDTLLLDAFADANGTVEITTTVNCPPGSGRCTGTIDQGTSSFQVEYSLDDIVGSPSINGVGLVRHDNEHSVVMTDRGVTLAQLSAAGRYGDTNGLYEYQGYGGWLEHSAFTVQFHKTTNAGDAEFPILSDSELSLLIAHSFGKASAKNPTATATWTGVMVGATKSEGHVIHGDATIEFIIDIPNALDITFDNIKNFNTNADAATTTMTWSSVRLEDGVFADANDTIRGNFYGDSLEEVGGIFDRDNIIGAFGAAQ